jgi:hypothetical protein
MTVTKTERIRALNDRFRRSFQGGRILLTRGVQARGEAAVAAILERVRQFDAFTADNDPHGEHDFGAFKVGDAMARGALYEAAQVMLTRVMRFSALKRWALQVAQRRGMKRAKVALARKPATVLHRMWVDGSEFRFGKEEAAAAA